MADFDHDQQEPAGLDGLPAMYSIVKGEVASVQTYGAFIKIPGYRKQGLVHISELSACRVENVAEVVDVGEQVWIKVIGREMRDDKVKLSFSMKAVNQGTGKDLDPNNVIAEQDERRRRQFKDGTGRRITLEAVLNTTCKKCGCKGHFAKDCFSAPGLQYDLIPEEGDDEPQQLQKEPINPNLIPLAVRKTQPPQDSHKKKKKEKKEKKEKKGKKKKRKRERKESESDSSSSGPGQAKRGRHDDREDRKKKKHKKHKSHKHI
ncbi:nucleolar protein of 40 kDa [Oncorhynchus mykiss]|uniref:Zinc finger CCHC domain-containing protein 17 n=1 Tax=Oncorhynchus mykiss TaxID=8022 RepID=A0A8L0DJ51_ONCMY|nr:nucleolar protein of 40 kDa [Oncorhynchus mykiss]XP_036809044.1 nucleolar protein of 40 kDa [Oncorhynchus mykiss]XP_036809045.1 nucleolar protein of 40 kDa [Oncorhynchus mykiss]